MITFAWLVMIVFVLRVAVRDRQQWKPWHRVRRDELEIH